VNCEVQLEVVVQLPRGRAHNCRLARYGAKNDLKRVKSLARWCRRRTVVDEVTDGNEWRDPECGDKNFPAEGSTQDLGPLRAAISKKKGEVVSTEA
jgi:hypothetical protein